MTGRRDSPDEEDQSGARVGRLLMVAVLVLAVAATAVLVLTDSARWLRLGVLAALWSALLGVLLAVRYRRQVAERANEAADLQSVYELELEREVAARREFELEIEAEARRKVDEDGREDLAELRAELRALRENLERLTGGEVLVERFALRAQSTRMRALPGDGPARVVAASAEEMRRSLVAGPSGATGEREVRRTVVDQAATELIARPEPVVRAEAAPRRDPQRREVARPVGYRPEPGRPQSPREGGVVVVGAPTDPPKPETPAVTAPPAQPAGRTPAVRAQTRPASPETRRPAQPPQPQQSPARPVTPARPAASAPSEPPTQQNLRRDAVAAGGGASAPPTRVAQPVVPPVIEPPVMQPPVIQPPTVQPVPARPAASAAPRRVPAAEPSVASRLDGPPPAEPAGTGRRRAEQAAIRTQRSEPVSRSRHGGADESQPIEVPVVAPSPGGRRRAEEPPDWQHRDWRTEEPARPVAAPAESADPEPTGAHAAGRSVTELLAAHSNQDSPRRHRRRAD